MQTFLVGSTIYLRPIEMFDVEMPARWSDTLFPGSAEQIIENLEGHTNSAAGRYHLVACRTVNDVPVASMGVTSRDGRTSQLTLSLPAILTGSDRTVIIDEMINLVVTWLMFEREQMAVRLLVSAGDPDVERAAQSAGMREAYVLREASYGQDGNRVDRVCWQVLHPVWLGKLGAPPSPVFGAPVREIRDLAPLISSSGSTNTPSNARLIGNRVYLRTIEQADAELIARWSLQETDTAFNVGRPARSPIANWRWIRKLYESTPPSWIRFAICLRSDDSVIGANGLAFIDWVTKTAETETEIVVPDYRARGYGTEAKHLLLEYGFNVIGLHMVRSMTWAFNAPSCLALRKQGYRDAGRINWTGIKDSEFADQLVFDLLASEWRSARATA